MAFPFWRTQAQVPPPPPPPPFPPPPPPPPAASAAPAQLILDRVQKAVAAYLSGDRKADDGSLVAVAKSIRNCVSGMSPWDISDLTLGLYKIATRHALEQSSDTIDGRSVSEKKELEEILHWLDWAWASYLADEKTIIEFLKMEKEQIKKHASKSSVTKPAYFIAIDNARKCVVLSIRGTYSATDVLTDLQPHSEKFESGYAHSGMLSAARWIAEHETENLKNLMWENQGFKLVLTGHSLGAGAACLLAFLLHEHVDGNISSRLEIPTSMIECWGYGCPPCVDKLLSANAPFIKNVVLQDDIVARVSVRALEELRSEILETDWEHVLEDGGMAKKMLSLVNTTNTALGNVERSLGYDPGTFLQHAKHAAYNAMMESFRAGMNQQYAAGRFYPAPGQYMNVPPQQYYGAPPPWGAPAPGRQSFLGFVSAIGSSAIRSYLNTPVSTTEPRPLPVDDTTSTSTNKNKAAQVKVCRLTVPGILYHIRRIPIEEDNTSSLSIRDRVSQLVTDTKKITVAQSKITSNKVAEKSVSASVRHTVVKGLNPKSRFRKIILSKSLLSDHTLGAYKDGIKDALHWSCHH